MSKTTMSYWVGLGGKWKAWRTLQLQFFSSNPTEQEYKIKIKQNKQQNRWFGRMIFFVTESLKLWRDLSTIIVWPTKEASNQKFWGHWNLSKRAKTIHDSTKFSSNATECTTEDVIKWLCSEWVLETLERYFILFTFLWCSDLVLRSNLDDKK